MYVDRQFGQRRRTGNKDAADQQTAEFGALGNDVAELGQRRARGDDDDG